MNSKIKYTLLILAFITCVITIYNHNNELTETSFDSIELKYAKQCFGFGILCIGLYFFNKKWQNLISKVMIGAFGISLLLNLYILPRVYRSAQLNKVYFEYSELKTCEEMEKRFSTDLKNGEVVYFQFGIGYDIELAKTLKGKYKIQSIGMGYSIQSEYECYNKLVNKYLKEKHNDRIIDY